MADIVPIKSDDVQPCPEVDAAEKAVITGLVHASGTTIILLNSQALNVATDLDLAA